MISEELKQAAHQYSESNEPLYSPGHRYHWDDDALFGQQIETTFIAGAEWMAKKFSKLYAEKFLSMQVQEPIPESIQKVIDDHFWEML